METNVVRLGDARELVVGIPDNSIDLIFTDPIYSNIDDYGWLAEVGARVLRPGKSLLALAGNLEKPRIYDAMRGHLEYHWEAAIMYRGANFFMNSRAIQVSWKPVLWFTKGKREARWCKDSLIETAQPKEYHRWQQSVNSAVWFIRQLTRADEIVLDPFTGFGSYLVACKQLGRRYIGFEREADRVEITRGRLDATLPIMIQEPPIQRALL